ncbi:MAG: hypothetical protein WCC94_04415, partial [Candidatus Bathyarchaeia archaeon]
VIDSLEKGSSTAIQRTLFDGQPDRLKMNRRVHDLKIDLTHEHGYISCIASLIPKDTKPCPQLRRLRFKTQRAITFVWV